GLQRLEVAPRHLEHVGHYAEEPGRELRLAEQRLHSLRDALEVALELEQGLQAGLGGRRLFPQPRERRVRRRELRSEIFQAPLDLGQHPPRLLELGFASGASPRASPRCSALSLSLRAASARRSRIAAASSPASVPRRSRPAARSRSRTTWCSAPRRASSRSRRPPWAVESSRSSSSKASFCSL